jgi:NADH dehydrogenase
MKQHIVIAGSGFAGTWAALSAARAVALAGRTDTVDITVVSPEASLHIRPRLYESALHEMSPDLRALFQAVNVMHIAGTVEDVDADSRQIAVRTKAGQRQTMSYDRFVLATGSQVVRPRLPGLAEYGFDVDQLASAKALDRHLCNLAKSPFAPGRNTVVVIGAGFTGIETAAEMPRRLRQVLGIDARTRVVLIERNPTIAPDLGDGPRPHIQSALATCGVEVLTSTTVAEIDVGGVTLGDGSRISAATVIWTAGVRANMLASGIGAEHDQFGRVPADRFLHARGVRDIFVTGDVARAATDDVGNTTLMTCQHALSLGRVAGHNAAAELVGLPLHPYSQPKYVTCLDLGEWGALYTEGWDRQVRLTGAEGKALKQQINTEWIYPPKADREAVFAVANPDFVIVAA